MIITESELRSIIRQVIIEEAAMSEGPRFDNFKRNLGRKVGNFALGAGALTATLGGMGNVGAQNLSREDVTQIEYVKKNYEHNAQRVEAILEKAGLPTDGSKISDPQELALYKFITDNPWADWERILNPSPNDNVENIIHGAEKMSNNTEGTTSFYIARLVLGKISPKRAQADCKKLHNILRDLNLTY